MPEPPAFIVHDLAQARAVLAAAEGLAVRIESAPGAAAQGGAAWFKALAAAAAAAHPGAAATWVLDCGAEAGAALGAIREGVPALRTRAPRRALARIRDIAAQAGVQVFTGRARGLDLGTTDDPLDAVAGRCRRARAALKKSHPSAIPERRDTSRPRTKGERTRP